ncbi:MAG: hypothetical protein LUI13_15835 [Lachnospiraceae bacterium]|nr:hypothetical protein [Lachnospiraceae bacterium]
MRKHICIFPILAVTFLILAFSFSIPSRADAASYQQLVFYNDDETVSCIQVGNYYFKQSSSAYATLRVSTKKTSGYKNTGIRASLYEWTNGKYIYYISSNTLYRYKLATGKTVKIKSLSSIICSYKYESPSFYISLIYGNYIYITRGCFDEWKYTTYCYNVKTGKLKKTMNNCDIVLSSGKYCIGANEYKTEASPRKITLYKISSSGQLKKIKVLGKATCGQWLVNGKFYYTVYSNSNSMGTASLYCCNRNGKGCKKLVTLNSTSNYIFIYKMTANYFMYYDGGTQKTYSF